LAFCRCDEASDRRKHFIIAAWRSAPAAEKFFAVGPERDRIDLGAAKVNANARVAERHL
jgi:hypothetical protein